MDNPDLISFVVVGDGEAETGPLATAWHSNKFLDPRRDGAVLPTYPLGVLMRDIIQNNPDNFRLFGPDETASNQLHAVYEVTKKVWWGSYLPEDADGSEMALEGRVMEMLSEHTLEGWLEGYLLTGRHGLLSTYEAFVHVIDSMFNQHAKWLEMSRHLSWRAEVPKLQVAGAHIKEQLNNR